MNFKRFIYLAAVAGAIFSEGQAEIIDTPHFADIQKHLTPNTLVILDIDDTLLIPVQMLGCDEWFLKRKQHHIDNGLSPSEALEKALAEWEGIRQFTRMEIVEEGSQAIVRQLQEQGYQVMGLSTQGLALTTRTLQQLAGVGVNLSAAAPSKEDQYLLVNGHGVLYRKGILFTSGQAKGEALFKLCDAIGLQPKRIVFLNDKATHLADIEGEATKRGVPFVGLRYAYSDARKAAFRAEVADYQFTHSAFDAILSDAEASEVIDRKSIR